MKFLNKYSPTWGKNRVRLGNALALSVQQGTWDMAMDGKVDDTVSFLHRLPFGEEMEQALQTLRVRPPLGFTHGDSKPLEVQHRTHSQVLTASPKPCFAAPAVHIKDHILPVSFQ